MSDEIKIETAVEEQVATHEMGQPDMEEGKLRHKANNQMDDAAKILEEAGGSISYTQEDQKRLLRKIDLYVALPMCLVYFIQQLDKSSLSFAAVFGIQADAHLQGSEYSWLGSVISCAQLVCQPLSSYALIVFPVKYWVVGNMAAWTICLMCTAAAKNFAGLLVCRMFLGAFEATILPSFIFITQMWWIRREQSYRSVAYMIANSFAGILGPLLSYGVGRAVDTSSHPPIFEYQGIFLFLGGISFCFVPLVWALLPNSPTTARFLRHGNDRLIAIDRLRANNTGTKESHCLNAATWHQLMASRFKWNQFWETYRDPKTYMWAGMWFCAGLPSGGVGQFGGLITKGFGFDQFTTILMQIPTGAIGVVGLLVSIYVTNKIQLRWPVMVAVTLFPIAGAIGLTQVPRDQPGALMACYYIAYMFSCIQSLLVSWCNLNAGGTTKRVVTTATMFAANIVGNIIGPQVYLANQAPYYFTGLYTDIACWCLEVVLCVSMAFYLRHLNKKQATRRFALGLPGEIKDMTIMPPAEAEAYKVELADMVRAKGLSMDRFNEFAFDDMTDFETPSVDSGVIADTMRRNPFFIYVL
ncbi:LOW QUALITY PROTEIN: hypothetical protein JCM24511_06178 [Saitozyma sp. JCM 24511]|nr:LOW QUALITY PROTEIN: hypothetical protein JCM24511_06178 [Saitozyma sp. JCM 24511]